MLCFLPENVFGVIKGRSLKPAKIGHFIAGEHTIIWCVTDNLEVLPLALPESGDIAARPLPERFITVKNKSFCCAQPVDVMLEMTVFSRLKCWLPKQLGYGGA